MTYYLHIKMINKPHPYPESPDAEYEAWGRIIIFWQSDDIASVLVDTEWDLALFSEWFMTNEESLCTENLNPPENILEQPRKSLAETISILHQKEFDPNEDEQEFNWFDYLFQYSSRHNIWNSLLGSRIPNILIGCNNGFGEISFYGDEKKWQYSFEMKDFIREVEQEIEKFLIFQKKNTRMEKLSIRIDSILQKIPKRDFENCC